MKRNDWYKSNKIEIEKNAPQFPSKSIHGDPIEILKTTPQELKYPQNP